MNNDGGPVFPKGFPDARDKGMSMRDLFAWQALKGSLNAFREGWAKQLASAERNKDAQSVVYDALANQAYAIADAMLKERQKEND